MRGSSFLRRSAAATCVLAVLVPVAGRAGSDEAVDADRSQRALQAARAEVPPVLDGVLDDPCWSACPAARDFFDMGRGCEASQPTAAMICYDDDNVYVAFECYEADMGAVSAATTQRDGPGMFEVDDTVAVLFDTYHDRRSCYAFAANLANSRLDLRVADAGQSQELAWDAVWDVATHRHDDRWTMEMVIPLSELRYAPGESVTWGVEFLRHATSSREDQRWVHYEGEALDPSRYAELTGLSLPRSSYGLDVAASAVGRYDRADFRDYPLEPEDAEWDIHPDAGLDVEWVPLPTLTLSGTLNPDFAQIEGDPNEINLSGDELYLEERRPFFSEGMELFQTPLTVLYTRRMEDIVYGAKAGGRAGTTNVGALFARSDDFPRTSSGAIITDDSGNPMPAIRGDYSAVALRQDLLGSATLGAYYAGRERNDSDYSRVAALTFNAPLLEYARASGMAAKTFNSGDAGEDNAYWAGVEYERSDFRVDTSFEWIGGDFVPETGFVSEDRRGRVGGFLEVDRDFQVGGGVVEEVGVDVYGGSYEGVNGGRDYWYAGGVLSTIFQNRLRLAFRGQRTHDTVDYPDYPDATTGIVELTTNLGAWSGYIVGLSLADYHNSTYYRGHAIACLQPHERVTVEMNATGVMLRDYEDVDWVVGRLRSDWMISRTSFVRLIAQGQSVRWGMEGGDYRSQQYDLNLLYGWEFSPGSMFYVAYNQPMERSGGDNDFGDPVVVAKVSYLFGL